MCPQSIAVFFVFSVVSLCKPQMWNSAFFQNQKKLAVKETAGDSRFTKEDLFPLWNFDLFVLVFLIFLFKIIFAISLFKNVISSKFLVIAFTFLWVNLHFKKYTINKTFVNTEKKMLFQGKCGSAVSSHPTWIKRQGLTLQWTMEGRRQWVTLLNWWRK